MPNLIRSIRQRLALLICASAVSSGDVSANIIVYQNTFDSGASISGWSNFGSASVGVIGGQFAVTVSSGPGGFGGASLNMAPFAPVYSSMLENSTLPVSWCVNVSNQDNVVNNGFAMVLACDNPNPFLINAVGYALIGGGGVGNVMSLWRFDHGMGGGGSNVVEIVAGDGLGNLPDRGSFRIIYEPSGDKWTVYGEIGTEYVDPLAISTIVGSGVDGTHTDMSLPYLSLLGNGNGSDFFDNLTVTVPEPSTGSLMCISVALGALARRGWRRKKAANE